MTALGLIAAAIAVLVAIGLRFRKPSHAGDMSNIQAILGPGTVGRGTAGRTS